jgi:hypothetical protein
VTLSVTITFLTYLQNSKSNELILRHLYPGFKLLSSAFSVWRRSWWSAICTESIEHLIYISTCS